MEHCNYFLIVWVFLLAYGREWRSVLENVSKHAYNA